VIYRILVLKRAQKELADLPKQSYDKVKAAILALAADPRPSQSAKLISREGWRLRAGDYRVIYDIDDSERTATVLHVGHRRDVYR
jgi:mRNA interferase RelE/StbE